MIFNFLSGSWLGHVFQFYVSSTELHSFSFRNPAPLIFQMILQEEEASAYLRLYLNV